MGRMIDADVLLAEIEGDENRRADTLMYEWYADMVRRQPTVNHEQFGYLTSTGYDEEYSEYGKCSKCGSENHMYAMFCQFCGVKIRKVMDSCLTCVNSLSGDLDGSNVLVCFEQEGFEGQEMIVDEEGFCKNYKST